MRLTLLFLLAAAGAVRAAPADDLAWFQSNTQVLYDAVASGDTRPWQTTLAEDCVYTSEEGYVQTKAELLKEFEPLPKGFSGSIHVRDLTVRALGADGAVVHYWADETETVFGQVLKTSYISTDSYRREAGAWKMVASESTVVPRDMDPVPVDPKVFSSLVGEYRISPDAPHPYLVFLRDGQLFGGRDEKSATRLIPLSPLVYFQSGSIHTMIFVTDAAGKITELREIHKYNELVEKRVGS